MSIDPVILARSASSAPAPSSSVFDSWIVSAVKKLVPYSAWRLIRLALARIAADYIGGEALFDIRFGTDTSGTVCASDLPWSSTSQSTGSGCRGTIPRHFRKLIGSLGIDYEHYIFVDFGSGKGRVLILASGFPFQRVIGIELFEQFHEVAIKNLQKCRARSKCSRTESVCMDATAWDISPIPAVYYLYNPFPETVFRAVLSNIEASLRLHPRHIILIYGKFRPWVIAALNESTTLHLVRYHMDRVDERCNYLIAESNTR